MNNIIENWVFLGDSLVEGIGSTRISFVTELVKQIRHQEVNLLFEQSSVHYIRLKSVNSNGFDHFVKYNLVGYQDVDSKQGQHQTFIWNFASEATTIESDFQWMPFIKVLAPSRIIIFRGSLESIVRPLNYFDKQWPWWVPRSWRGLVSMDPRCYYSTTWWRRLKQRSIDQMKQWARLYLLSIYGGKPLQLPEVLVENYQKFLMQLDSLNTEILICGLLPISKSTFPGSLANFAVVNNLLEKLAADYNADFLDWASSSALSERSEVLFYRDGFHPNQDGATLLGKLLINKICDNSSSTVFDKLC